MHKEDRNMMLGAIVVVLVIVVVGALLFADPLRKTPADKIAISYGGGMFEGAQYQQTVEPGSGLVFNGLFDKWYEYPTTQRNYIVSSVEGEGDRANVDGIRAFTSDKVETVTELTVTFKLNTNEIRDFHEKIGLKFNAWEDDGWDRMLNDNFRQPLENSVQQVIRQFDVDKIASDTEVLTQVQDAVESTLKAEVNKLLGGDYFCGPGFEIGQEDCPNFKVVVKRISLPEGVVAAFERQETSAAEVVSAQNDALAKKERAEGEKAQQEVLTQSLTPEYISYLEVLAQDKCAQNTNCVLVVGGGNGTNINVPVAQP